MIRQNVYPVKVDSFKDEPEYWIVLRILETLNGSRIVKRQASILFRTDDIENGQEICAEYIKTNELSNTRYKNG